MIQTWQSIKIARTELIVLGMILLATNMSCGRPLSQVSSYQPLPEEVIPERTSISGKVLLVDGRPSMVGSAIDVGGNPFCSGHEAIKDPSWVVSDDGGLANVVIFVRNDKRAFGLNQNAGLIDQKNCQFLPYLKGLQVGQSLQFQNSDLTFHNIRIVRHELGTRDRGVNLDNIAQPAKGDLNEKNFTIPGVYRLECDVHRWMKAWVFVHDTAHFAVSDNQGSYAIKRELPDGVYQVEAWHPQFPETLKSTVVITQGVGELNFTFSLAESFEPKSDSNR